MRHEAFQQAIAERPSVTWALCAARPGVISQQF